MGTNGVQGSNSTTFHGEFIDALSDGTYVMDGKEYKSLGALLMALCLERADNIEDQILDQAKEMKSRNNLLQGLAELLSRLRSAKDDEVVNIGAEKSNIPKPGGGYYTYKEMWKMAGLPDLQSEEKFGGVDYCWGKEEREEAIGLLKAKMDSLNSESQMDMIRLQGLMSKRDNVYQMASNLIKTDQRSKTNAISNLR